MVYEIGKGNFFNYNNPRNNKKHDHHGELNDGDLLKELKNKNNNSKLSDKELDKLDDYYKGEKICKVHKDPKENIKRLISWVIGRGCLDDKTHALIIELVNELNEAFEISNKNNNSIRGMMGITGGINWEGALKDVETLLDKIAPEDSYLIKDSGVYRYV